MDANKSIDLNKNQIYFFFVVQNPVDNWVTFFILKNHLKG